MKNGYNITKAMKTPFQPVKPSEAVIFDFEVLV